MENINFRIDTNSHPTRTLNYYVEALPGQTDGITFNGKLYVLYNTVRANLGYLDYNIDFIDLNGFTNEGTDPVSFGAGWLFKCYYDEPFL